MNPCSETNAFFDEPFHTLAFLALGAFSKRLENLFQSSYVLLRLSQVLFEPRPQIF
jgi:hypothetical protein